MMSIQDISTKLHLFLIVAVFATLFVTNITSFQTDNSNKRTKLSYNGRAVCPKGWILSTLSSQSTRQSHKKLCVRTQEQILSWEQARHECRSSKGFLVKLDTKLKLDNTGLTEYLKVRGLTSVWTGMYHEHETLLWDELHPHMVKAYYGSSQRFGWRKRGWTFDYSTFKRGTNTCGKLNIGDDVSSKISGGHADNRMKRAATNPRDLTGIQHMTMGGIGRHRYRGDNEEVLPRRSPNDERRSETYLRNQDGFGESAGDTLNTGDINTRVKTKATNHIKQSSSRTRQSTKITTVKTTTTSTTDQSNLEDSDDYPVITKRSSSFPNTTTFVSSTVSVSGNMTTTLRFMTEKTAQSTSPALNSTTSPQVSTSVEDLLNHLMESSLENSAVGEIGGLVDIKSRAGLMEATSIVGAGTAEQTKISEALAQIEKFKENHSNSTISDDDPKPALFSTTFPQLIIPPAKKSIILGLDYDISTTSVNENEPTQNSVLTTSPAISDEPQDPYFSLDSNIDNENVSNSSSESRLTIIYNKVALATASSIALNNSVVESSTRALNSILDSDDSHTADSNNLDVITPKRIVPQLKDGRFIPLINNLFTSKSSTTTSFLTTAEDSQLNDSPNVEDDALFIVTPKSVVGHPASLKRKVFVKRSTRNIPTITTTGVPGSTVATSTTQTSSADTSLGTLSTISFASNIKTTYISSQTNTPSIFFPTTATNFALSSSPLTKPTTSIPSTIAASKYHPTTATNFASSSSSLTGHTTSVPPATATDTYNPTTAMNLSSSSPPLTKPTTSVPSASVKSMYHPTATNFASLSPLTKPTTIIPLATATSTYNPTTATNFAASPSASAKPSTATVTSNPTTTLFNATFTTLSTLLSYAPTFNDTSTSTPLSVAQAAHNSISYRKITNPYLSTIIPITIIIPFPNTTSPEGDDSKEQKPFKDTPENAENTATLPSITTTTDKIDPSSNETDLESSTNSIENVQSVDVDMKILSNRTGQVYIPSFSSAGYSSSRSSENSNISRDTTESYKSREEITNGKSSEGAVSTKVSATNNIGLLGMSQENSTESDQLDSKDITEDDDLDELAGSNNKTAADKNHDQQDEPSDIISLNQCGEEYASLCSTEAIEELSLVGHCDRNWYGHRLLDRCYKPFEYTLKAIEAGQSCLRYSASLATVDTGFYGNITTMNLGFFVSGTKVWVDASLNLDVPHDGKCAALEDGLITTVDCNSRLPFICQKDAHVYVPYFEDLIEGKSSAIFVQNLTSFHPQTLWCPLRMSAFDDVILWFKDGRPIINEDDNDVISFGHANGHMPNRLNIDLSVLERVGEGGLRIPKPAMLQGQYWCEIWRREPFNRVISDKIFLKFTDVITLYGRITTEPTDYMTAAIFNRMGNVTGLPELMERRLATMNKNITHFMRSVLPIVRDIVTFIKSTNPVTGTSDFTTYIRVATGDLSFGLRGNLADLYLSTFFYALDQNEVDLRAEWNLTGPVRQAVTVTMADICPETNLFDKSTGLSATFPSTAVNNMAASRNTCNEANIGSAYCKGDLQSGAYWDSWSVFNACSGTGLHLPPVHAGDIIKNINSTTQTNTSVGNTGSSTALEKSLGKPPTSDLAELSRVHVDADNIAGVTNHLADILDQTENLLSAKDIESIAKVFNLIVSVKDPPYQISDHLVKIVNKVLDAPELELMKAEKHSGAPSS